MELLEALGRRPRVLVGSSFGGTIVLWMVATCPELVRGVAVFGTSSVVEQRARLAYLDRARLALAADQPAFATATEEDLRAGLHRADVDVEALVKWNLEAIGDASTRLTRRRDTGGTSHSRLMGGRRRGTRGWVQAEGEGSCRPSGPTGAAAIVEVSTDRAIDQSSGKART